MLKHIIIIYAVNVAYVTRYCKSIRSDAMRIYTFLLSGDRVIYFALIAAIT